MLPKEGPKELPEDYNRLLEHMGRYFAGDISLRRSASGKGTMTVRFSSDEEIQKFLKLFEEQGS